MPIYDTWNPSDDWDRYVDSHPCSFCLGHDRCPECPYRDWDEQDDKEED